MPKKPCPKRKYQEKLARRKALLINALGGECAACGETAYPVLQFHHLLKYQHLKRFELQLRNMRRKLPVILAELKLCILLCSNCHILVHEGVLKEPKKKRRIIRVTNDEW